jgi:hypothetical protein
MTQLTATSGLSDTELRVGGELGQLHTGARKVAVLVQPASQLLRPDPLQARTTKALAIKYSDEEPAIHQALLGEVVLTSLRAVVGEAVVD